MKIKFNECLGTGNYWIGTNTTPTDDALIASVLRFDAHLPGGVEDYHVTDFSKADIYDTNTNEDLETFLELQDEFKYVYMVSVTAE